MWKILFSLDIKSKIIQVLLLNKKHIENYHKKVLVTGNGIQLLKK